MKFIHISHNDLDGFGCQFTTQVIFKNPIYYNANYGLEVKMYIKDALQKIATFDKDEEILFLITDLNLTTEESRTLNRDINNLNENGYKINLQLLDHHGTGQPSADKYDWYYLDTTRSATKITYDYLSENYENFKDLCPDSFENLINAINAVDIWLEDNSLFEFGKVCMSMISKAFEINNSLFDQQSREYKFYLLTQALNYVNEEDGHIHLDENIYKIKKAFLNINDVNDTMDNISSQYLVKSLAAKKDELTIYYQDKKGLLTYNLGGISIPANAFLKANPDFDFFLDINRRGRAGFRANNNLDVSLLAQKLAGGGGHPNASGAAFKDFKESVIFNDVKKFIQNKLDNCD